MFAKPPKPLVRLLREISCLTLVMFYAPPAIAQAPFGNLPELGEASERYLNAEDEKLIGQQFFQRLLTSPNYIADPELRHYLNTLGRTIGASANLMHTLKFNLIRDSTINAFAVPGGYITFHSGLLLATENESELASVVSHEIAHISQRHLPRLLAQIQSSQLSTTAAVLASILIGGQAGVAGATLATAAKASSQLAYTRDFEREADAIGTQLMVQSGFDPRATATFFAKLQRFNFLTQKDLPEFLRTHPLSYTRIAESEARIRTYPDIHHKSSLDFHLARSRALALYGDRNADTLGILEDRIRQSQGIERQAWQFGQVLALLEDRQIDPAMAQIEDMILQLPETPQVHAAKAEILLQSGETKRAAEYYAELVVRFPDAGYLRYAYLNALLQAGNAREAKQVARRQLRRQPEDYELYPLLSRANVALDLLAEAHQADAEFHIALGQLDDALHSLKLALRENDNQSAYLTTAIEARMEEIEQALEK